MRLAPVVVLASIVLPAATLSAWYAARTTTWAVMTDELLVARLAVSIAETLSPLPTIHGVYYGAHSQLYPLLLAPFYGTLSAPAAAAAAHALNGLLLAGAAIPAYLLGRSVTGGRAGGYVAAALTAFTPWLALSATLLTENAAYPAFVWAVLLCHRTMAQPGARRDVLALAGLGLAFLARTQLLVLAAVLPVALLLHELGCALRREPSARAALRRTARSILAGHRVLVVAYAAGALVAGALALQGSLGSLVGNYTVPFEGNLVPDGFWRSAAAHLDQIAVGAGLLPLVLAASWACATAIRSDSREAHAFAALLVPLVAALTFQVTSFDLRFTPEQFIQERYLVYVVPLLAVGAAGWLAQRTAFRLRLATLSLAAALFVGMLGLATYDLETLLYWTSPAAAFHPAVVTVADALGVSAVGLLQVATVVTCGLVALGAWRVPRATLVATGVAVSTFGALQAVYVFERYVEPTTTPLPATAPPRDWIDRAVPGDRSVALVPGGPDSPVPWWEAELWNKRVDRVLEVDAGPTYSPFPSARVSLDIEHGALVGAPPSEYLVVSSRETRFGVRADEIASARGLSLLRVDDTYRLEWATRGVASDGWTLPRRLALLRLYGADNDERRIITLTLAASRFAPAPADFVLRSGFDVLYGEVHPGGARPPVELELCVPAGGHTDVWLTSNGHTRLPDGRDVAVHVERLTIGGSAPCNAPGAS